MALLLKTGKLDGFGGFVNSGAWYPAVALVLLFSSQPRHCSLTDTFVVGNAVEPPLVAVLLRWLIRYSDSGAWRVFANPVVRYPGRITYPLNP